MNQIKLHKEIDEIVAAGSDAADTDAVEALINENFDARDYFFEKIDASWIDWLCTNDFFEKLYEPAEDPTRYSYRMPEINYLEKVVNKEPDKVTKLMLGVDPKENFNPEVVDRFTRIAEKLEGENLKKMVEKIHDENWVKLMENFGESGYVYKDILEKLIAEEGCDTSLALADTVLTVRENRDSSRSNLFVLDHISQIDLFTHLRELAEEKTEEVFNFAINKLAEVIGDQQSEENNSLFEIEEAYYFLYSDFFMLDTGSLNKASSKADIENFMKLVISATRQAIEGNCDNADKVKDKYQKIEDLKDSRTGWRLQLFALSLCPEVFADKLEQKFNRLFKVMDESGRYYDLLAGAEYRKALRKTFNSLDEEFKRRYVENIFSYFAVDDFEGSDKDKRIREKQALKILHVLRPYLDSSDKDYESKSEDVFGYSYKDEEIPEPKPSVVSGEAKTVRDRSPVNFAEHEISDIPELLKKELSPGKLNEEYASDTYDNPRNAEGVGNALRGDVKKRVDEYLKHAKDFFDPQKITSHYTYSFLQGIENHLRDDNEITEESWKQLFQLLKNIENANLPEENTEENSYLMGWQAVRTTSARIVKYSLSKDIVSDGLLTDYRKRILNVISSLLKSSDPQPKHEASEHGDLFNIAINSTRGVAYQSFIQFVYKDGDELEGDIETVFANLVSENESKAVWFVIGHYLPTIYFRAKSFTVEQLSEIFNTGDINHFYAAWSGYLSASVYQGLFEKMLPYYLFTLRKKGSDFPERKIQWNSLDEALGKHMSLAYTHFDEINTKHELIQTLFNESDAKKQNKFLMNIGRSVISGDLIPVDDSLQEKLMSLWGFVLEKESLEAEAYSGFGFWVSEEGGVFELSKLITNVAKTLEKSDGVLDYTRNLKSRLKEFAQEDPDSTLTILEEMLLKGVLEHKADMLLRVDGDLVEAFDILHSANKKRTEELISDLWKHPNGGRRFWGLEKIIEN